jgi:hypothetical protein
LENEGSFWNCSRPRSLYHVSGRPCYGH